MKFLNRKNLLVAAGVGIIVLLIFFLRSCSGTYRGYTITLKGEPEITITQGSTYEDPGIEFRDDKNQVVTNREKLQELNEKLTIEGEDEVDPNVIGNYTITYTFEDTVIKRIIHVVGVDEGENNQGGTMGDGDGQESQEPNGEQTPPDDNGDHTGDGDDHSGTQRPTDGDDHGGNDDGNHNPVVTPNPPTQKIDYDMGGVRFEEASYTYDGTKHYLRVTGKIPDGVTVTYVGNGKVDVGNYVVIAQFKGDNRHNPIPDMSAIMHITKASYDMSGVSFSNATFEYDGQPHSVYITGDLPAGLNVEYTGNNKTEVGTYQVTAKFTGDKNHYSVPSMTAKLIIKEKPKKLDYDLSQVEFNNKSFTYDGTLHSIAISGQLPEGLSVYYEGNGKINAGTYDVIAHFVGDEAHNPVPDMHAVMTIEKAIYDMSGISFKDATFTYDGREHSIFVSGRLPDGVSVEYVGNGQKKIGTYTVVANFIGDSNHHPIRSMSAKLTIRSGGGGDDVDRRPEYDLSGVTFPDGTFVYDKTSHSIFVKGQLPSGVSVSYTNNGKIETGVYTVVAHFTGDSNHKPIPDRQATLSITQATYDMSTVSFTGKTFTYDGEYHSLAISGRLPDGVEVKYSSNNRQKDIGEYVIVASFTGDSKNYKPIAPMEAKMIIKDGSTPPEPTFDLSNVKFDSAEFEWDDQYHSVSVDLSTLPNSNIQVSYPYGNYRKDLGKHQITAIFSFNGKNIGTKEATLTIYKKVNLDGVQFTGYGDSTEIEYQAGVEHSIYVNKVPEGTKVEYMLNGAIQTGNSVKISEVGVYNIVAKFDITDNDSYRWESATTPRQLSITIRITDGSLPTIDLTNVKFEDGEFEYDGNAHSISVNLTTLPDSNIQVSYPGGNSRTDHGEYTITAAFTLNGTPIGTKDAKLTIYKTVDVSGVTFTDYGDSTLITYDSSKSYTVKTTTLPEGATVKYTLNDTPLGSDGVSISEVGSYHIVASYELATNLPYKWKEGSTHDPIEITITIVPSLNGVSLNSKEAEYTGSSISLETSGTIPTGVDVSYSISDGTTTTADSNSATNIGVYTVTATFTAYGKTLDTKTATLTIYKTVDTSSAKWLWNGTTNTVPSSVPAIDGGYTIKAIDVPENIAVEYKVNGNTVPHGTDGISISDAGEHSIVVSFSSTNSTLYRIADETFTLSANVKIFNVVTFGTVTWNYANNSELPLDATHSSYTIEATLTPSDHVVTTYKVENGEESVNAVLNTAGDYTITAIFKPESGYMWSDGAPQHTAELHVTVTEETGDVTIYFSSMTVTWNVEPNSTIEVGKTVEATITPADHISIKYTVDGGPEKDDATVTEESMSTSIVAYFRLEEGYVWSDGSEYQTAEIIVTVAEEEETPPATGDVRIKFSDMRVTWNVENMEPLTVGETVEATITPADHISIKYTVDGGPEQDKATVTQASPLTSIVAIFRLEDGYVWDEDGSKVKTATINVTVAGDEETPPANNTPSTQQLLEVPVTTSEVDELGEQSEATSDTITEVETVEDVQTDVTEDTATETQEDAAIDDDKKSEFGTPAEENSDDEKKTDTEAQNSNDPITSEEADTESDFE